MFLLKLWNVLDKITEYRIARKWTEYQLAEQSGLPQSTISSWYRKNQTPTIPSLEKICNAFNISLSQFFSDEKLAVIQVTDRELTLFHEWNKLSEEKQTAIFHLLKVMWKSITRFSWFLCIRWVHLHQENWCFLKRRVTCKD